MKSKIILGSILTSAIAPIAVVSFLPTNKSKDQQTNINIKANYNMNRQARNSQNRNLFNRFVRSSNSQLPDTETNNAHYRSIALRRILISLRNISRRVGSLHPIVASHRNLRNKLQTVSFPVASSN